MSNIDAVFMTPPYLNKYIISTIILWDSIAGGRGFPSKTRKFHLASKIFDIRERDSISGTSP